jgi:hypothetical protein
MVLYGVEGFVLVNAKDFNEVDKYLSVPER